MALPNISVLAEQFTKNDDIFRDAVVRMMPNERASFEQHLLAVLLSCIPTEDFHPLVEKISKKKIVRRH